VNVAPKIRNGAESLPEAPEPRSRMRSFLFAAGIRLALVSFGLVLSLLFFEIAFRIVWPSLAPARWSDLPKEFYFPESSKIDRDYAYPKQKPANTYRIFVVGDSFSYGGIAQIFDTFPKKLETYLNLNTNQPKVEVINYSKPGTATIHHEVMVRKIIQEYSPDLIVLQITLNDPEPLPYRVTHSYMNKRGEIGLHWKLFDYWKSLGFVIGRLIVTRNNRDYEQYFQEIFAKPENWNNFSNSLGAMARVTQRHNVRFAAMIFPLFSHALDDSYPFANLHQKIHGELEKDGVPYLDLLPAYKNIPADRLQAVPGDNPHPSELAYRIAADYLYRFLRDNQLVPEEAVAKRHQRQRHPRRTLTLGEKEER
jgi:hypothetical protein